MKKILRVINAGKSQKNALLQLLLLMVLSLILLYIKWEKVQYIIWWLINLNLVALALSLVSCSLARIRNFRGQDRAEAGLGTSFTEQQHFPGAGATVLGELTNHLVKQGFQITNTGQALTAVKNRSGLLGSVAFHLGLVIILLGFLINALWGFHGILLLPERVLLKVPEELSLQTKGIFVKDIPTFYIGLDKFSYGEETGLNQEMLVRPTGELYFRNQDKEGRQRITVNYPAKFSSIKWQYKDSGYSLLLNVSGREGMLINDFVNIASHQGTAWGDTIALPGGRNLSIKFYPDFRELSNKQYSSKTRFPKQPVTELTLSKNAKTIGQSLIPLGQTKSAGELKASFTGIRYWVLFDVIADPGRSVIFCGGLLAIVGLAWRLLYITKIVACKLEKQEQSGAALCWGARATFSSALLREEIRTVLSRMEGK